MISQKILFCVFLNLDYVGVFIGFPNCYAVCPDIKEGLKGLNVVRNVSLDFRVDKLSIYKRVQTSCCMILF